MSIFFEIWHRLAAYLLPKRGIQESKKNEHFIILSITSYKLRMKWITPCLNSLFSQSLKPNKIILWVGVGEEVPKNVLRFQKWGLDIRYVEDVKSYKKYIYTRKLFPEALIVTADDDTIYHSSWLKTLYQSYIKNPHCIHFYTGRKAHLKKSLDGKISFSPRQNWDILQTHEVGCSTLFFPTGVAGILYGVSHNHPNLFNKALFTEIAPTSDDIWFKTIALLKEIPSFKVKDKSLFLQNHSPMYLMRIMNQDKTALRLTNNAWGDDLALSKVASHYPQLMKKLYREAQPRSFEPS